MKKGKQFASLLLTGAMLLSFAPMSLRAVALSSEGVGQTLVMSGEDSSGVETTNINLAEGRPVTASGAYSGMPASNLTDGSTGTRWASPSGNNENVYNSWFYIDLGEEPVRYNKIELAFENTPQKYRVEVSDNGQDWQVVEEVVHEDSATLPKGQPDTLVFDQVLTARYVKFQGVEPRHNADGSINVWGYSLYEFRVFQAPAPDDECVAQAKEETTLPQRAKRDFTLPLTHDNGTSITWASNGEWITVKGGTAVVKRDTVDQSVTLTATFTKGDVTDTRDYTVVVPADQQVEGAYDLYPIVHRATYQDTALSMTDEVNLVLEDGLDEATRTKAQKVLEEDGIQVSVSQDVVEGKTNVLVGIDNDAGVDNEWFEGKYDPALSTEQNDGYALAVDDATDTIAIMGRDSNAAFYGVTTMDQILEQTQADSIRDVLIEDYAEVQFRGFIEGFYGTPWSHENRMSLMEFGGDYKMNSYLYGPKNDPYHAGQWRDPYPADKLAELKELVEKGHETKVQFVWAAHIGGKIDLASEEDFQALCDKFDQMYEIGVRQFALFFDDSATNNTDLVNFVTRLDKEYIKAKGDVAPIIFCPQYYRKDSGSQSTINYLKQISQFPEDVQIMWTGDNVVSAIKQSTVDWVTQYIERPVYIWWNYPVNDLGRASYVHMGPSQGLYPGVTNISGFTSNPMNQAQASKISLFSVADYTWNTEDYDSQESWQASFTRVIRDDPEAAEALRIFSAHSSAGNNPFGVQESVYMREHLDAFQNALMNGEDLTQAAADLEADFDEIIAAVDTLKAYKGTGNISGEISRWTDKLQKVAVALKQLVIDAATSDPASPDDPASVEAAMEVIERNRTAFQQAKNASGTVASQVLIPFGDNLLASLEARLMADIHLTPAPQGFGSMDMLDYTKIVDGDRGTSTTTGSYFPVNVGAYFGVNLGRVTDLDNVTIYMAENAYFKEGVVEVSTDNKTWTELGTFDGSTVHLDGLDVKAQFIRYRATDEFVDPNTGSPNGMLGIQEFVVNEPTSATLYTNVEGLDAAVNYESGRVSLENVSGVTLQPGDYLGFRFNTLKNAHTVVVDEALQDLQAEFSLDGKTWKPMDWASTDCMTALYVRLVNQGSEARTFNLGKLEVRLGGVHPEMTAEAKNIVTWSGSAANMVDGNRDTTLWLKPSENRTFILDLGKAVPIYDVKIHCVKDALSDGQIRLSSDGTTWSEPISFSGAGLENLVECGAVEARYIEITDNIPSKWIQVGEIEVNTTVPEDVLRVSGSVGDVDRLVDSNLFTSVSAGQEAGEMIWNNAGLDITNLVVVKNSGAAVTLWAEQEDGTWKEVTTVTDAYGDIDLGEDAHASAFKFTWEENSGLTLHEIGAYKADQTPEQVNKTLLEKTIAYAKGLDTTGVTDSAKAAFEKALREAEAVMADANATQTEVNAAWDNLLEGIWGLGLVQGDKTMLEQLINKADGMIPNEDKYMADHWQELVDALAAAKDVMADGNAMEGDVQPAAQALLNAILAQRFKADKSILEDLVNKAEGMDLSSYTAESVAVFRSALAEAQAVMADNSLSEDDQKTVDAAVEKLSHAMDGLTAGGAPDATDKPETSQKPETTQKPENNVPQTGDNSGLMLWLTAGLASLGGAVSVFLKKKRQ